VAALGRRHVGAVAGILDLADGQLLISGTGSLRATNGSAPDADTTLEIGSITKTFTALALAHAVVTAGCHSTRQFATSCRQAHQSPCGTPSR